MKIATATLALLMKPPPALRQPPSQHGGGPAELASALQAEALLWRARYFAPRIMTALRPPGPALPRDAKRDRLTCGSGARRVGMTDARP